MANLGSLTSRSVYKWYAGPTNGGWRNPGSGFQSGKNGDVVEGGVIKFKTPSGYTKNGYNDYSITIKGIDIINKTGSAGTLWCYLFDYDPTGYNTVDHGNDLNGDHLGRSSVSVALTNASGTEYSTTVTSTDRLSANTTYYMWFHSKNEFFNNVFYDLAFTGTANATARTFTITYNANGGTGAPAANTYTFAESGTTALTTSKPTRTGYTFVEWNTAKDGSGTSYSAGGKFNKNKASNTTLYAIWRPNKLKITFAANGGSISSANQTSKDRVIKTDNADNIPKIYVKSTGNLYSFNKYTYVDNVYEHGLPDRGGQGLETAPSGYTSTRVWEKTAGSGSSDFSETDTTVTALEMASNLTTGDRTILLYAQWKKTLSITYDPNGGSGGPGVKSKDIFYPTKSYTFTIDAASPTRTGYTFLGWSTSSTATTASYVAGNTISRSANLTLFAVWAINSTKISYDCYNTGAKISSSTYYFDNTWNRICSTSQTNTTIMNTPNVFYHTVNYGSSTATKTFSSFGLIPPTGKYFTSWKSGDTQELLAEGTSYSYSKYSTESNTSNTAQCWLSAQFSFKQLKIIFNKNDGSNSSVNQTVTYNTSNQAFGKNTNGTYIWGNSGDFGSWTRAGYTLLGWSTSQTATTQSWAPYWDITDAWIEEKTDTNTALTTLNLYAVWKANTNTPYKVHHRQQTVTGGTAQNTTNFSLVETENLTGTTDSTVTPSRKSYSGFTAPSGQTVTINGNGTTEVTYYYTRNSYTVTLNKGTGISSVSGAGTYKYQATVPINATLLTGYKWVNWTGTYSLSDQSTSFYMPASNVTLTANGQLNVFTLTYKTANTSNVSEMPSAVTNIVYGTNQTITSTVPRWFPKTFMGWSSSSSSSTVSKKAGETIAITGHTDLWTVFQDPTVISLNNNYSVNMDFSYKHYYFKFTPAHTGMYRFTTSNSTNLIPQIDIYNSSGSAISGGNLYTGTTNIDKSIVLTGNTDYYIRFVHYSYNGSFTFKVQETTYSLNYWANNSGTSDTSITNMPSSSSEHSYNESVTISSTIPRKFPYQFDDWYSINEGKYRDPGSSFNIQADVYLRPSWVDPVALTEGDVDKQLKIINPNSLGYYKFIPTKTATYVVYSGRSTSYDPRAYLLDSNQNSLSSNDDHNKTGLLSSEINSNSFLISYKLTAGTTYYYKAQFYTASNYGNIYATCGPTYTLIYKDDLNLATMPSNGTKYYNLTHTLSNTTPSRGDNWTFDGWKIGSTIYSAGAAFNNDTVGVYNSTNQNYEITATSQWSKTITLSYSANGKNITMPASVSQKITNSTTSYTFSTTKPSVTSTNGYTLIGWSLTSGGKNVDVALDGEITLSNSATLYAVWKKTLTLKYAKNGRGVMPDAQSCDIFNNETTAIFDVSNLSTTEIDGYTFQGWGLTAGQTTVDYDAYEKISITANTTLYAIWKKTITITYQANGRGTVPTTQSATIYNTTETAKFTIGQINSTSINNYNFQGWSTNKNNTSGDSSYQMGKEVSISNSIILYAIWAKTVTVTYYPNGRGTVPETTYAVIYNEATQTGNITIGNINSTTIDGYSFQGWGTSSDAQTGNSSYAPGKVITISSNLNLYAVWKKTIYLSYDKNGRGVMPATQNITIYNTAENATFAAAGSPTNTTVDGYVFQGWGITAASTTPTYSASSSVKIANDTVLYAIWKKDLTLNYDKNGRGTMPASTTLSIYNKETQKEFTISSSTFADNDGYKFLGWNTDKNAITSNYSPGGKIIITSTEVSKTLYAIWEKTITLQYNKNGRGVVPNAQEQKIYNTNTTAIFTLGSPTNTQVDGYNFVGWGDNSSDVNATYSTGGTLSTTSDKTIYAIWKKNIVLSYDVNGGSGSFANQTGILNNNETSKTFTVQGSSTSPTRDQYEFLGWYSIDQGINAQPGSTISLSNSTTLTAVWRCKGFGSVRRGSQFKNTIPYVYDARTGAFKPAELFIYSNGDWRQSIRPDIDNYLDYEIINDTTSTNEGFKMNINGFYESQNAKINSSYALCDIKIKNVKQNCRLFIDYIYEGEKNCDYGIFSNIVTNSTTAISPGTGGATSTSNNIKYTLYGQNSNSTIKTLNYGIIDSTKNDHKIQIKYRKDGSVNTGKDSLQFRLRIENI